MSAPIRAWRAVPSVGDLIRVVQDGSSSREDRLAAGAKLALACDPRPGVLTLEPAWCPIPGGAFVMGSGSHDAEAYAHERPQHLVRVSAFRMARYPVTNGQWQSFVNAGGYKDSRWWTAAGRRALEACGWTVPRFWGNHSWSGNHLNHPVVGVSWYEALAYCRWLSSELADDVRICTEAEWEKAARGVDGRIYPFGNELDGEALPASDTRLADAPTPVGCYPRGASPWGVEDMVGNTYAWTTSRWGATEGTAAFGYPYNENDGREDLDSDDYRVVRGGAWSFPLRNARCAYRGKDRPADAFGQPRHQADQPRVGRGEGAGTCGRSGDC